MENKATARTNAPEAQDADAPEGQESRAMQPMTYSKSVTRSRQEKERAATAKVTPSREGRPRDPKPAPSGMGRYLEVLGLGSNPTFDAINTAYFTCIKRLPQNPTEEDEARLLEVKRAYDILKRNYQPKVVKARFSLSFNRKTTLPLLAAATLLLLGGLVALNWKSLRLKMIHYDNGTVVALKGTPEPYGRIVGYEPVHRFPAGNPSAAYELRLEGRETTVWVSERLVVNGMQPLKGR